MSVSRLDPKKWTKDGRKWNFHVRYKDLDGKTKQYQSKLFKTKPEAQEAERVFLLELDKYSPDNNMTFRDLYLAFYDYQEDKVKETTLHTYKDRMRYMALLDNIKVKEFNLQHYEMWRKKILEYPLSNRTRNYIYKFLKTIWIYVKFLDTIFCQNLSYLNLFQFPFDKQKYFYHFIVV